jgi:hypothetical protein
MTEDRAVSTPDPAPGMLEVTVSRSGGVAGMVRRWTARIPDDGTPAARAARRISGLAPAAHPGEASRRPDRPGSGPSPGRGARGRVRDAFQWTVTCGDGSASYDEDGRRRDPDLDALIDVITRRP